MGEDDKEKERELRKDTAMVAALLSGRSVDFNPHGDDGKTRIDGKAEVEGDADPDGDAEADVEAKAKPKPISDREAVTQAMSLAAAAGKVQMLDAILRSPLELRLDDFDPQNEALQAAVIAALQRGGQAGQWDAVTLLMAQVWEQNKGDGFRRAWDSVVEAVQAQRWTLPLPLPSTGEAMVAAAEKIRQGFKPLEPLIAQVQKGPPSIRSQWTSSELGKLFIGRKGSQDPLGPEGLAAAVVEHSDDLRFISKRDLTWMLNIVAHGEGAGIDKAMGLLSEVTCTEPYGWALRDLGLRISALARHLDVPACQTALVRLASDMPGKLDALEPTQMARALAQLGGGLGHAHELVKRGVLPPAAAKHITSAVAALADWILRQR